MYDELRKYWHPVARAANLNQGPVAAQLLDEQVVLFRMDGEVVALQDLCAHRGTALSLGWLEDDEIVCHYHGWRYDKTGTCTLIPSLPEGRRIPPSAGVPRYRAEERYGLVWLALEEPRHPIPSYPSYDDENWATVLYEDFRWRANAARVIENLLDHTHFPWVHNKFLGDRNYPVYPDIHPEILDDGMSYAFEDHRNGTKRSDRLFLPFSIDITLSKIGPNGFNYAMFFTACRVSAKETLHWFFASRDWSLTTPDEDAADFDVRVLAQDKAVVESQRPEELPRDLTAALHLTGTDAGALNYRRMLRDRGVEWHH